MPKVVDGRRTQLATKEALEVPAGHWHTLEIECRGNKITCELDDKKVLQEEDDTFQRAGQVGLWTKADAQTYFDNDASIAAAQSPLGRAFREALRRSLDEANRAAEVR